MKIISINNSNMLSSIETRCDLYLLLSIIIANGYESIGRFWLEFIDGSFYALFFLPFIILLPFILYLVGYIYQLICKFKTGYLKLDIMSVNKIKKLIPTHLMRKYQQLNQVELIVNPTDFSINAKIYQPNIIALSAGMVILSQRFPEKAKSILCHELAHLLNGDSVFYCCLGGVLSDIIFLPFAVFLFESVRFESERLPFVIFGIIFRIILFLYLLRRREYMADAIAVNWLKEKDYLNLLVELNSAKKTGLFHPSVDNRIDAITSQNPVLSSSGFIFIIIVVIMCNGFFNIKKFFNLYHYGYSSSTELIAFLFSIVSILILPIISLIFEMRKGLEPQKPFSGYLCDI